MILKKLLVVIFLLGLITTTLFAKSDNDSKKIIVQEVTTQGNINVKKSKIKNHLKIKRKKEFSQKKVDESIRSLLETGLFEDVQVEMVEGPLGVDVLFKVVEKPRIVSIVFQGNEQVKARKFKSDLKSKKKEAYEAVKLSIDEDAIAEYYREKGYAAVKVESYVDIKEELNTAKITFYITEGKKTIIKEVLVEGNKNIKTKKILKKMKNRRKKVFKEDLLEQDIANLIELYKQKGYLKVEIEEIGRFFDENGEYVTLKLLIKEGKEYIVGDITFSGNIEFMPSDFESSIALKRGKVYKQEELQKTLMGIQEMYSEKGFIQMILNPEFVYTDDIVNIVFNINENQVVYIDRIYIDGNYVTRDYVIRRSILVKEKEPFNVKKIRRSQERIYNLGFFQDVQIDLDQTERDKADLVFSVVEQKTGLASVGVGYSSQDKAVGTIQVTESNLFGKGQSISLLWEFGKTRQNYQISFNDPYFFKTNTSFGFDVFNMLREREFVYNDDNNLLRSDWYKERHQGGNIRFGRRLSDIYYSKFTYGFDRVKIYDADTNDTSAEHLTLLNEQNKGEQDTSSITLALSRDTRNNVFYTTRGSYSNFSSKFAGGVLSGDSNFSKFLLSHSWFMPTIWKFVLAFNFEGGMVTHFNPSTEVPIYERFYVGGAESVRGYDYRGDIGPGEGGNFKMVYNVEYKFPIVSEQGHPILQGAFFADMGGSWLKSDEVTMELGNEENQMKAGVGFGIRFTTPVFPIRLDWGYGLNQREGKDPRQFYFTIGQLF